MISVPEAQQILLQNLFPLPHSLIQLEDAAGKMLAEDVISPASHPFFDQSAVDGYAFRYEDLGQKRELKLFREIKAGDSGEFTLPRGHAARIFTGAPLPPGADTIIMQEFVETAGEMLKLGDERLKPGGNVRPAGQQIHKGDIALPKGARLDPAAIGFLASLGIFQVNCFAQPKVHVITTGSEFAETEADLTRGKIFESNGVMLVAALREMGLEAKSTQCIDDLPLLTEKIRDLAPQNDLLILTGGVSIGDYDFTLPALEENQFQTLFHNVWQKPGKPLLFASKENTAAFGLPGNPRAVLVCFYEYVYPYLRALQGMKKPFLPTLRMPLVEGFNKKQGRAEFLTAAIVEDGVSLRAVQGSHMLQSFAGADALVYLPPNPFDFAPNESVEVHILPR
ncbi:MAG: molybdopterin molybdotransferase MoeA [Bacteroidia bacterium]|nr:molybdopterin molybdotransferase MoeA [Bacteroidia bacterium]